MTIAETGSGYPRNTARRFRRKEEREGGTENPGKSRGIFIVGWGLLLKPGRSLLLEIFVGIRMKRGVKGFRTEEKSDIDSY